MRAMLHWRWFRLMPMCVAPWIWTSSWNPGGGPGWKQRGHLAQRRSGAGRRSAHAWTTHRLAPGRPKNSTPAGAIGASARSMRRFISPDTRRSRRVCDEIVIAELQDRSKTARQQYLPLMEVAHKEDPDDAQICFWLGRDLTWAKQPERASELLQRYLALPSSTWGEERSEAMRCLARAQPEAKMSWLDKARLEAPHRREIWADLGRRVPWPSRLVEPVLGLHKWDREHIPDQQLSGRSAVLELPFVRPRGHCMLAPQPAGPRRRIGTEGAQSGPS